VETELPFRLFGERIEITPGRLEQRIGSDDVGLDEFAGAVDRTVDVRFGGEMHDDVGPEIREDPVQRPAVADIGLFEAVTRIGGDFRQRFEVAGVG